MNHYLIKTKNLLYDKPRKHVVTMDMNPTEELNAQRRMRRTDAGFY